MLDHVFHANIAYCQQNRYVLLAIYTDLFTLSLDYLEAYRCLYPLKNLLLVMHALGCPGICQYQH